MDLLLLHPPATKPGEPPLGVGILLGHLRAQGLSASSIDANLEAYLHLLDPTRLSAAAGPQPRTALKRAVGHAEKSLQQLRSSETRASFARYSTAVRHLNEALSAYPSELGELTLGDYLHPTLSEFSPEDLERLSRGESSTVFAAYFRDSLVPRIAQMQPRMLGISVQFRNQVLPAFELAGMLRRAFPGTRIVGGGGMFTSWRRPLKKLGLRFSAFDHIVFGPGEAPLAELAAGRTGSEYFLEDGKQVAFVPDYSFAPLGDYLSPERILPLTTTRGCYWAKCLFCPEATAPIHRYRCSQPTGFAALLTDFSARHQVRHFHLTDDAIPVNVLRQLASQAEHLQGLSWHGFVRFEKALLDKQLVAGLARAGCTQLQLGLESGSQQVLDRLQKGTRLDDVSQILANLAEAGIGSYVYILFGTPGETEEDGELTLRFLEQHASEIGFLNLAIMNLPRDATFLENPELHGIRSAQPLAEEEPLGLYRAFEASQGWERAGARRFLQRRVLGSPAIRAIAARTPPLFTSNHAFLFEPAARLTSPAAA